MTPATRKTGPLLRLRFLRLVAAGATAMLPLLLLTGCASLFVSKRKLLVPIAPSIVQSASADELVKRLNDRWAKFQDLTAAADIRASRLKAKEGVATDYPSFRAILLINKPNELRILAKVPVLQTTMFDLGSDGTQFTFVVPHNNKVYEGLNASKGKSPTWYENLRPGFLFDSMYVRGIDNDDFYSVISDSHTEEDPATKRLLLHPEYILTIQRRKPDSHELYPVRVIHIHREDLMPYEQDLYDDQGNLETQVIYGAYKDFEGTKYPGTITLKRPQDEYQLVMSIERVTINPDPPLTQDQFHVAIPDGYTIQKLD